MKSFIALLAATAAIATALLLSSCSSPAPDGHEHGSGSSTAGAQAQPAQSNAADVAFATDMIPHHQQAVAMSGLVPDRSTDPAVIKLASEISAAQGPEIETMKAFLVQWSAGQDASREGHGGTMEGMQMPGMVDDVTMTKLASLKGVEFDRLFLQSMIGHHEGAISMANTEIADGVNADAKTLAKQIVTAQQAEIGHMKQMLGE
ncbi:MAG: hypothetical protein QOI01_288 [Mycobacterium sp.]|jgi:uncharacterized protein (DUF305 family)|nr:hypothetical protein [Mycobacterium sp.]